MGSNADGNTTVKWMRDEQCSLVTLLTACCSCIDCKLCSIGLEMNQNLLFVYVSLYSLIHYAPWQHSLVLICGDGYGVHGDKRGWGSISVPVQTSTLNLAISQVNLSWPLFSQQLSDGQSQIFVTDREWQLISQYLQTCTSHFCWTHKNHNEC